MTSISHNMLTLTYIYRQSVSKPALGHGNNSVQASD